MNVSTIEAESVLARSELPDAEYAINPTRGARSGADTAMRASPGGSRDSHWTPERTTYRLWLSIISVVPS
jgi:hypothetical protein